MKNTLPGRMLTNGQSYKRSETFIFSVVASRQHSTVPAESGASDCFAAGREMIAPVALVYGPNGYHQAYAGDCHSKDG